MATKTKSATGKPVIINGRLWRFRPDATSERIRALIEHWEESGMDVKYPVKNPPSIKTLEKWSMDGIARATDGCKVEPDGRCPHGHESWIMVLGYI